MKWEELDGVYLGHVLPRRLNSDCGAVATGVTVHAAHHRCDGRLLPITSWRMSNIRTQEDDRLLENRGPGPQKTAGHYQARLQRGNQILQDIRGTQTYL